MASPESVINGRFKILERPASAPGKCAVCGSVERPVLDFGFDLDFYGVVYICVDCLREGASVAGILGDESVTQVTPPPIDYEGLNEFVRSLSHTLKRIDLIVPDHIANLMAVKEDADGDGEVHDGTIPDAPEINEPQPEPLSIAGPNDRSDALNSFSL